MRWFWIDRFTEFVAGERAVAVKNLSLAEQQLHGHLDAYPYMPASLIVEGLAQTGGLLVAQQSDFHNKVVLAKVGKAVFHRCARPGEQLRYETVAASLQDDGAVIDGTCRVGEEVLAEVQIMLAYLGDRFDGVELFTPVYLATMLNTLGIYEIGTDGSGNPLKMPEYLRQAMEQVAANSA